ncbi:MAG: hypothetical protein JRE45_17840 [Deltaproteobacteria bacterium]|nr:hypothetical protein [Deltaproteobacteria bacterium]MBW2159695.1 hypothetical protein [Deltaproteobacteria bacterium]MBW2381555.1 hypothetical protein [Deltaproteobacteria bacterium]MBW2586861.1 hypothetical protein [Deltaproteobacteria bacterium]MBW2629460.1 hypothetical protein [Deltaproteobacteria bacterium]
MKTLLSIAFAALVAVAISASGAHADNDNGTCNSIVARAMGAAQACWNFGCVPTDLECPEVGAALLGFFSVPACGAGFASGDLEGLTNSASVQLEGAPNAGDLKHIQEVICNAIVECEFCDAAAAAGVCGPQC